MDGAPNQAVGEQAIPVPPLPLSDVEELREQLRQKDETILQKDRMFQKACLAAREAELRAERAETILDTKRDIIDGSAQQTEDELQKRLADLYNQLEGARRSEEDLSTQLEVERRRRIDAERKTDAQKIENVEWKRRGQGAESVKEAQLHQIEILKDESKQARKEAEDLKDSMKKKCEMHDKEKSTLKEEVDDERKKKEDSIRNKEALLRQIEILKNESGVVKREAKKVEDNMKKKCEVLKRENADLKKEMDDQKMKYKDSQKKMLKKENALLSEIYEKRELSHANSKLKGRLTQLEKLLQQQVAHTVQDHSLDDGGDFNAAREATNPAEGYDGLRRDDASSMMTARDSSSRRPTILSPPQPRRDDTRIFNFASQSDEDIVHNCICGQKEDDGEAFVRCDQCVVRWEHVDCIFPRTKKAPTGLYFCHVCKPRPTELTPKQARAYQDRVKMKKEQEKKKDQEPKKIIISATRLRQLACKVEKSARKIVKSPSPVMRFTTSPGIPVERNIPAREDRKLQAMCERLEKEKKRSGGRKRGAMNDANEDSDVSTPVVAPPKKTAKTAERGKKEIVLPKYPETANEKVQEEATMEEDDM